MSRLDSFIRRLQAQMRCLDLAAELVSGLPGPVLELGLGHGRTYDHLRFLLPGRQILVFEREVNPAAVNRPPSEGLILGDIRDTLPASVGSLRNRVALIHADIGTGDPDRNARLAAFVSSYLPLVLAPGGVVVSDQAMDFPGAERLPLPCGVKKGRYNLYRMGSVPAS